MKKIFLIPALLVAGFLSASTTVATWQDISIVDGGNTDDDRDGGIAVTTDGNGNVYAVGNYSGNTTIGTDYLSNMGTDRDIYVAKYTSSGTFVKAVKLGSAYDDEAYSIAWKTDGTNNYIFVSAYVNGSGKIYVVNDNASLSTYITRDLGSEVRPRSIFSYGTNRLMVGGSFRASCALPKSSGSINFTASNSGSSNCTGGCYDSFTGIIDMSAYFLYAGHPNSSTDNNEIKSVCCRNGYIYTTGYFQGNLQWKSGGGTMTAAGNRDVFIASVYMSGSLNQCTFNNDQIQAGSIESQPAGALADQPDWMECGYGIAANGTAIYVTGNLNNASTPLFDGSSYSGAGAFTARINYSGSQLGSVSWIHACVSGGVAVTRSIGYAIALDANGDVYSSGASYADTYFTDGTNSGVVANASNSTDRPGYIVKFNSTGTLQWVDAINQQVTSNQRCTGYGLAADGCTMFCSGWLSSSGSFQAGTRTPESVAGTATFIFGFSRDFTVSDNIARCEPCTSFPLTGGMTATGGTSYSWSPTTYLANYNTATPTYSVTTCTTVVTNYSVTISNATCTTSVPFVLNITGHPAANAGSDAACPYTSYYVGVTGTGGFTYSWAPVNGYLTAYNVARPAFSTTTTAVLPITYTLTQTDPCGNVTTDQVTITASHSCRIANPNGTTQKAEIFPNPSTGIFTVNLPTYENESDVDFIVTDLSGRTVQQNTVITSGGPVTIDLSAEAKGMYMLTVTRNGVSEVYQLITE